MERRDFLKLTPALPAVASVRLTAKDTDGSDVFSADIGVLRLKPGDVLAVFVPHTITQDTIQRIKSHAEHTLVPVGVKVAVFAEGISLGVLRADA